MGGWGEYPPCLAGPMSGEVGGVPIPPSSNPPKGTWTWDTQPTLERTWDHRYPFPLSMKMPLTIACCRLPCELVCEWADCNDVFDNMREYVTHITGHLECVMKECVTTQWESGNTSGTFGSRTESYTGCFVCVGRISYKSAISEERFSGYPLSNRYCDW